MKRLINPRTNEVVYLDLITNTIYFSDSKTAHKVAIQNNPDTHMPQKVSVFTEPVAKNVSAPVSEPAAEKKSDPVSEKIDRIIITKPFEKEAAAYSDPIIPETEYFDPDDPFANTYLDAVYKISA